MYKVSVNLFVFQRGKFLFKKSRLQRIYRKTTIDTHFTSKEKEMFKKLRENVTKTCVALCSKNIGRYDIVSGFIKFAQTLLEIRATIGNYDERIFFRIQLPLGLAITINGKN